MLRALIIAAVTLVAASDARAYSTGKAFDWGPLASRQQDVDGVWRFRAAGPFHERAAASNAWVLSTWRPFYSRVADPAEIRAAQDFLWPLATARALGRQSTWRCLLWFGFNHDLAAAAPRERTWLIPFYFSGRDATGGAYRAIFPFGGTIREFLGRDEISFVLFPIRSTSRLNDLHTSNWIWPIYAQTRGPGVYRFRVFPFYMRSVRDGQFDRRAILWPFWSHVRYDDPRAPGEGYMLWPLWGRVRVTGQDTWWFVPPLFKFADSEERTQINAPWPFVQYARSKHSGAAEAALFAAGRAPGYRKLFLWPLWGRKQMEHLDRTFALWPLLWWQTVDRPGALQERFVAAPFWFSEREVTVTNGAIAARRTKLWPLYSYSRRGDASRFRSLALWPFADAAAVERNWAPLWTVVSRQRNGEDCDTEALWGLYRDRVRGPDRSVSVFPLFDAYRQADPPRRGWSLLKGLVGREQCGSHVRWRVLYFLRFGSPPEELP